MKILEREVNLRDETRAAEQLREVVETEKYVERANSLAQTQRDLNDMTQETIQEIQELEEEKELSFPKEKELLMQVSAVMGEVVTILEQPNTGAPAVAAESEIIEMLLQVQRKQPPKKNSKGKSGKNPNGGGDGDTEESALALLGRGDEVNAQTIERATNQATGTVGSGYPAEYRVGLDAYFGELEK